MSCSLNPSGDKNIKTAILAEGVNEWANQLNRGKSVEKSTALSFVSHVKGEMEFIEWVDYLNSLALLTPTQAKEISAKNKHLMKQYGQIALDLGVKLSKNDNLLTRKRKLKEANKKKNNRPKFTEKAVALSTKVLTAVKGSVLEETPKDAKTAAKQGKKGDKFKRHSTSNITGFFSHLLPKTKEGQAILDEVKDSFIDPVEAVASLVVVKSREVDGGIAQSFKDNKLKGWKLRLAKSKGGYSVENAINAYMFSKRDDFQGELNGATPVEVQSMVNFVENNPTYKKLADEIFDLTGDQWITPTDNWDEVSIQDSSKQYYQTEKRKEWLDQSGWTATADAFITPEFYLQLSSVVKNGEAAGKSLKLLVHAMKTGSRFSSGSKLERNLVIANSTLSAATLGFNPAIMVKQTTSGLNFIQVTGPNNVVNFVSAMGTKEYYAIMKKMWYSDYIQNRKDIASFDVDFSAVTEQSGAQGYITLMNNLRKQAIDLGFSLVSLGDASALLWGGPAFILNYQKKFMKEGLSEGLAYQKAFELFEKNAESTQQSKKITKVTSEQLETTGKLFLTYKSFQQQALQAADQAEHDLKRQGDGDWKKATKEEILNAAGKIVFYRLISPAVFSLVSNGAASALAGFVFDDEDERNKRRKKRTDTSTGEKLFWDTLFFNLEGRGVKGVMTATSIRILKEAYDQTFDRKRGFQFIPFVEQAASALPLASTGLRTVQTIDWAVKSRRVSKLEVAARFGDLTGVGTGNIYDYGEGLKYMWENDLSFGQDAHLLFGFSPYNLGLKGPK